MEFELFKKIILGEENFLPDKTGMTPLQKLGNELKKLPPLSDQKKNIEFNISKLAGSINELNLGDIRRLIFFLEDASIYKSPAIASEFMDKLDSLKTNSDLAIEKRGLVLKLIIKNSDYYLPADFLQKEAEIKKVRPFIWLELMANRDWESCISTITEMLKKNKNAYESIRPFFSIWIEDIVGKQKLCNAFHIWYEYLNEDDQKDILRWATNRDIPSDFKDINRKLSTHARSFLSKKVSHN